MIADNQKRILEIILRMDETDGFPFVLSTFLTDRKNDLYFAVYKRYAGEGNPYYEVKLNSMVYHASDLRKCLKIAFDNSLYWEKISGRKELASWFSGFLDLLHDDSIINRILNRLKSLFKRFWK